MNNPMSAELIIGKSYTRKNNKCFSFGSKRGEFIGYTQAGSPRFKLPASRECFIDSFDEDEFIEAKQEGITKVGFLEKWVSEDVCKEFGWDYKGEIINMEADLDALFSALFSQYAKGVLFNPVEFFHGEDIQTSLFIEGSQMYRKELESRIDRAAEEMKGGGE